MTVDELVSRFRSEGRISLTVRVTPKPPGTAWAGCIEDGKANAELVGFLARQSGADHASVRILSRETSRVKLVAVHL